MSKKEKEFENLFKKDKDSCRKLDLINVGMGTSGYQGDFTKHEIDIIKNEMNGKKTLHLFSGSSTLGDERIDFDNPNATHKGDVFEFLRDYENKEEKAKVVVLDPPYLHEKSIKEYTKAENIYRSQQSKVKLKKEDLFHAFDPENPQQTRELFDLIAKNVKPEKIVMKSWNYYVPEGYHDTCRSSAGYAGGYRKTTYIMVLERNDLEPTEKKPIHKTRQEIPIVYEKSKDSMKQIEEKDKKELVKGKKTLIIDKDVQNPFDLIEKSKNMDYDSVLIDDPNIDLFSNTKKTTEFFRTIRENLKPNEIILKTDRIFVPPAYELDNGKAYISKGCDIPEYLIKTKYNETKLKEYTKKQEKAIENLRKKMSIETDPKKKDRMQKSIENLINKIK